MDKALYFIYVVFSSIKNWRKLFSYSRFFKQKYKRSKRYFLKNAFMYYFKYSMLPIDYFYFDVYGDKDFNPNEYATTLFMYKFHKKLNKKTFVQYFLDKRLFNQHFKEFMGHKYIHLKETSFKELEAWIDKSKAKYLMIKKAKSVGGFGVKKLNIEKKEGSIYVDNERLKDAFKRIKKYDILEEFVVQHESISELNPSCLNTVRVVTVIDKFNEVNILAAAMRLGVDNDIDNFHAGGIAVNIDIETGCLDGEGFKLSPSDPWWFVKHPSTQVVLDGYSLPHWELLIDTVKKASLVFPQARTIGWDVAITPNGISLIEGNHNWYKLIMEKALKRGIRKELEVFLS